MEYARLLSSHILRHCFLQGLALRLVCNAGFAEVSTRPSTRVLESMLAIPNTAKVEHLPRDLSDLAAILVEEVSLVPEAAASGHFIALQMRSQKAIRTDRWDARLSYRPGTGIAYHGFDLIPQCPVSTAPKTAPGLVALCSRTVNLYEQNVIF